MQVVLKATGNNLKKSLLILTVIAAAALAGPAQALCASPQRIVSLAPSITEILYAIGLESRLVAVSDYCDRPAGAKLKPKIGGLSNPSLEMIVSLRPDIVLMTTDGNPKDINDRLVKLGIRTYVFEARRIAELPGEIRRMGAALGAEKDSEKLARRFERTIAKLRTKSKTSSGRALCVIQPEPLIVAAGGNAIQDALEILGWANIAAGAGTKYVKYSIEELIRQSPDVILIGMGHSRMVEDSQDFLQKIRMLPAVKNGRVYFISDALFRLGPRVIDGIEELSEFLNK
jgi:iron complex transport system substrate-binding protein